MEENSRVSHFFTDVDKTDHTINLCLNTFEMLFSQHKSKIDYNTVASLAAGSLVLLLPLPMNKVFESLIAAGACIVCYTAGNYLEKRRSKKFK